LKLYPIAAALKINLDITRAAKGFFKRKSMLPRHEAEMHITKFLQ